ncbi:MAG: ribonuclease-3 [Myxococcota bacterium]
MTEGMAQLEERLGYTFTDRQLFAEALTHSSYAHEQKCRDNERLEFLGDAVLQVAISHALFAAFPKGDEGRLSRARAMLVNTQTLAMISIDLGLDKLLRLGKGEADSGGRTRRRSLAASTEALLGALYLDGGHAVADDAVAAWFATRIQALVDGRNDGDDPFKDPRSRLQETTQAEAGVAPTYRVIDTEGPAHSPCFSVEVSIGQQLIGSGTGSTKREAMKHAAADALSRRAS